MNGNLLALLAGVIIYVLIGKMRLGYEITFVLTNRRAANAGGISSDRVILPVMAIAGGPAGLAGTSELNFNLRGLAERTDFTVSYLSQIERDLVDPSIKSLRKIANALSVPILYFLAEPQQANPVVRLKSACW